MYLSYWLDEVVRLVQEEGYLIRKACYKVKLRKEHFEKDFAIKIMKIS